MPRVEETAGGGNSLEGNPSGASTAPPTQVQPQTAQNTAQGDSATPLETGTRQRTDAERQRAAEAKAAEAKAAREAALVELNRERQQKRIRDAQELTRCLNSGMGLLTPEQVRQITNAVTGTNNEPMDTLRSFNERLEILREENPHASSADLNEAAESTVQALITKNAKEQQRKPGPRQTSAVFEVPREALHLPESCRAAPQDIPGPPSGRTLRGAGSEVKQMHNYISCIRTNLHVAIGNRDADLIRSYRRALNSGIASAHEAAKPTERQTPGGGTLSQSTVCFKRWRNPRPHCCWQPSRCCRSWRKRPEPAGKSEQSTTPHRLPTWRARHSRP